MKTKTADREYVRKTCNFCNRQCGYRSYRNFHHTPEGTRNDAC